MNPVSLFGRDMPPVRKLLALKTMAGSPFEAATETGNPAQFTTNVAKNLKGLSILFSDDNGISGLNIYHAGANLFDEDYSDISTTATVKYRSIYVGNVTVTMSTTNGRGSGGGANLFLFAGIATSGGSTSTNGVWNTQSRTVTAEDGWITIAYRAYNGADPREAQTMLNVGETSETYAAYAGSTHAVTFTKTVNAGTFEATTGVLTVTSPEAVTIQLEAVTIKTLNGVNAVWTDTGGENTVTYLKKKA